MKKSILTIFSILFLTTPLFASTKCVKLPTTATCNTQSTAVDKFFNKPYWTATCDNVSIQGVADCFSSGSTSIGSVTTTTNGPNTTSTLTSNIYCKCKIVSPFVSRWVTPGSCTDQLCYTSPLSADTCKSACAAFCAIYLDATFWDFNQTYKTNIFNNRESIQ